MKTQRVTSASLATIRSAALGLSFVLVSTSATSQVQPQVQPASVKASPPAVPAEKKSEPVVIPDRKLTPEDRVSVIRGMTAELGFARKSFPFGKTGLTLNAKSGQVSPDDAHLQGIIAGYGPSIKVGDRARITDIHFKDKSIIFELNGGPVKKKKWYEHIQISGSSGTIQPGQPEDNTNLRGSFVELAFDKFVPDLTTEQLKQLLDPVVNFHSKSATEAYLETIPPAAKAAIVDHRVLVGMDREMVVNAKGRPPQKIREKDGDSEYEEWIYGVPPQDVEFVRFVGDEVIQVKTMKVDGTKVVRTEREVTIKKDEPQVAQQQPGAAPPSAQGQQPTATAQTGTDADEGPKGKPSLKRPGEDIGTPDEGAPAKVRKPNPTDSPSGNPGNIPNSGPNIPAGGGNGPGGPGLF